MEYATTILQVAVHRTTESPVFGEGNTYIKVEDEGGGPFLVIEQDTDGNTLGSVSTLRVDYQELVAIAEAGKMLMHQMYIEEAALNNV